MSKIKQYIDRLASTTKRKEKAEILEEIKNSENNSLFLKTAELALDPRHKFNIIEYDTDNATNDGEIDLDEALESLNQYLVIEQLRGEEAKDLVEDLYSGLSSDDAYVFKNVIDRTLKCGVSSKTINSIWPDAIYEHPHMRCSSFNEKNMQKIHLPAYSQLKEDGRYIDIAVDSLKNVVEYRSRQGEYDPWNYSVHDDILLNVSQNMVLMGEALVYDEDNDEIMPREIGNGYLNSNDADPECIVYRLWDCVPIEDWHEHECHLPYEERLQTLINIVEQLPENFSLVDTRECHTKDEIISHFRENVSEGLEGSVIKNKDSIWKSGTSKDQVKMKPTFEVDLRVIDVYEGEKNKKYENMLGGLICHSLDGDAIVHVGSGFSDQQRKELWNNSEWIIDKIVTVKTSDVKSSENNDYYTLSNPVFVETRKDKVEEDNLNDLFEQKNQSVNSIKLKE